MYSTSIIFDRKGKSGSDKEGSLEVRITVDRKSYYISTGVRVLRKHWAGAIVKRPDADALNNRLGIIVRRVNEKVNEFIEARKPIDVAVVKEYIYDGLSAAKGNNDRLLEWMKKAIEILDVKEDTRKHYWVMYDRIKEYGKMRTWGDVTVEGIYEWNAWLKKLPGRVLRRNGSAETTISDGTIHNYHKDFKSLLSRAVRMGVIDRSPYDRLRGEFSRPDYENVEYLDEEQIMTIVNTHPVVGSQYETVRDLFVFQMFTGLSYSDMQVFDIKNYHKERGAWVANGQRIKTGVPYVAHLLPPVVDVLERNGWKVPPMTNQKYNFLLKTFGSVIGIDDMHSHLARHTFATYMLSNDSKLQNVMRMMGHKKIDQTMKYAKVLAKDVHEDYDNVAQKLKRKKK